MKADKTNEKIPVPIEVFLDVSKLILAGNLDAKIDGIRESTGNVLLHIEFYCEDKVQVKVVQRIIEIVEQWNYYRFQHSDLGETECSLK